MQRKVLVAAAAMLLAPTLATAQVVANGSPAWSFLTGQRSAPVGGLISGGTQWAPGFVLDWNISYDVNSQLYTYVYTTSGFITRGGGGLSHLIVEFTPGCTSTAACVGNVSYTDGNTTNTALTPDVDYLLGTYTSANGNPGIPGTLYGLKLNAGTYNNPGSSYSFTTSHAPVWGDFYAKGGSSNYAYNVNFGLASGDLSGYIVRPDGVTGPPTTTTPEPASMALLASGLLLLGGAAARRRMA